MSDGRPRATTTVEILQELTHVRARRRDRTDAADRARDYALMLRPLLEVKEADMRAGLDLFSLDRVGRPNAGHADASTTALGSWAATPDRSSPPRTLATTASTWTAP